MVIPNINSSRKLTGCCSTESDPSNLQTICGDDVSKVESQIVSLCGSNTDAAMKAFVSTCSAAGKTVRMYMSTLRNKSLCSQSLIATYSSSASGSASATGTGSMVTTTPSTMSQTIQYTSTFFDSDCSCTKTTALRYAFPLF